MVKQLICAMALLLPGIILSQSQLAVIKPSEESQINGVIQSLVQGIRQQRIELMIYYFDQQVDDGRVSNLTTAEVQTRIETYFMESGFRKTDSLWSILAPADSLPPNWDFAITQPQITIEEEEATASFQIYWLMKIPLTADAAQAGMLDPTQKIDETWSFRKIDYHWKISKMENLLQLMDAGNSAALRPVILREQKIRPQDRQ